MWHRFITEPVAAAIVSVSDIMTRQISLICDIDADHCSFWLILLANVNDNPSSFVNAYFDFASLRMYTPGTTTATTTTAVAATTTSKASTTTTSAGTAGKCSDVSYTSSQVCDNGHVCPSGQYWCGSACYNPSTSCCSSNAIVASSSTGCKCGSQVFSPSTYVCDNSQLCPSGTYSCGSACYSPSSYSCCSGALTSVGAGC